MPLFTLKRFPFAAPLAAVMLLLAVPPHANAQDAPAPPVPVSPPSVARKVNPRDGAELVLIPAGPFLMGDDDMKEDGNPRHKVTLPAYFIYKNDVTVAMYEKFCAATGRKMPDAPTFNDGWSKKNHAIVNVTWNDAKAYCDWAGASLPSEAQWEKAARGTDGRAYPWGNTFDASKLSSSVKKAASGTFAVGSFPSGASPYGVLDMAGNVCQWCDDWCDAKKDRKALHGGSWLFDAPVYFRCAYRNRYAPVNKFYDGGFRCVLP